MLGDGGQLRHAVAMTGLDLDTAIRLAAGLVRVEVLATADPPRFLHPIVRAAVESSMATDDRHEPTWPPRMNSTGTAARRARSLPT